MNRDTILTMADGHGVDLDAVTAADVNFPAWIEHIAKEPRFNGATEGVVYGVAQHLVLGIDAMLRAGATDTEAAYFGVHDLPEAIWKDDPTPKKMTIARRIERRCGVASDAFLSVLQEIEDEHEAAVHQAAGLVWPIPDDIQTHVKYYDKKMFVTEWRDLMGDQAHPNWTPYLGIEPLPEIIVPWDWQTARCALNERLRRLLPALRRVAV